MTSNKEVDAINLSQLKRFARDHGKPVLFWQYQPTGAGNNDCVAECMGLIADDVRGMMQYFVE